MITVELGYSGCVIKRLSTKARFREGPGLAPRGVGKECYGRQGLLGTGKPM